MPDERSALQEAQEKINELLDNARSGAIIPVRLPGQIEEIAHLIQQAQDEQQKAQHEAARAAANAVPADMEDYMAEEAYFVGHAVHELRTPMTSIRGYADMLGSMGELNDMQKQFLEVIRTNAKRMEALMQDVSFVNKVRKKTLNVAANMDMFKNIALKVEKAMQPVADELGRKLSFDIPQGLPLLTTDGDMFALALQKFVENGLRYNDKSADDGGEVLVWAEAEDNVLVVHVEDNGIGIAPEDLQQLGTIYFRSENDVVREYKGSGLGIPVAFGVLDMLGASYDILSEPGVGTRVTVRLPGMS